MSAWNAAPWIANALNHLAAQTQPAEIIIVDSGSTDQTPDIIALYKVSCLRTHREPLYTAWNRGLRLATGDYIFVNNCDDWAEPTAIARMAEALDKHPEAVLAYCDMVVHHEDGHTDNIIRPEYDQYTFRQTCLVGCSPMFRKQAVLDVGGFDESLVVSGDQDMWCKISERGTFIHVPGLLSHYSLRTRGLEYANRATQLKEDNVIRKRYA
mgnify:FL=1